MRNAKTPENLEDTPAEEQGSTSATKPATSGDPPSKSRRLRKDSLENLEDDPWGSPALHNNHTHSVSNEQTTSSNPTTAKPLRNGLSEPSRTTSAFTTHSEDTTTRSSTMATDNRPVGGGGEWGVDGPNAGFTGAQQSGFSSGGFGLNNGEQGSSTGEGIRRSLGGGRTYTRGVEETVTVSLLPEKEGMFMFQHHNYEVKCARKASSVVRRYSDFVWLLDCLHKRYPFRQLPLLPPKRVAGEWQTIHAKYAKFTRTNKKTSQRKTPLGRCDLYGEASPGSRSIWQCTCQASGPRSRTTRSDVLDCTYSK